MQPFFQLVPARIRSVLHRVHEEIWFDGRPVEIAQSEVTSKPVPWSVARHGSFHALKLPVHWGRLFDSCWFRLRGLSVDSHPRWLEWRDQGEATLYLSDVPYYGFDVAHRSVLLPPRCKEAWIQAICCQSAIWHPAATGLDAQGSNLSGARVVRRNETAWAVYHDLTVLQELALELLKAEDPAGARGVERPGAVSALARIPARLRRLLAALDRAADEYDTRGLVALQRSLAGVYAAFPADSDALRARLIGHAHIDLVWLWPERIGEAKAVHTFATVNRLMAVYPELRFSYSQPASYEAVARLSQPLLRLVRKHVAAGRWEATGATYVESDTLLACGESLLRSFQLGQEWFRRETGQLARVLWLPDVFGYSACVPQLARQSGVESFFTNKHTWSRITPFPHSSFRWRGQDGSELLAHVSHETQQFYNGCATVRELNDGARDHRQSDCHEEFLVPTGYGDGGGGPTEEMCERARRLSSLAGVPRAGWDLVEPFFSRLDRLRGTLPVWSGEIYLEYHRGVFTTHGDLKAVFRAAERGLQVWEAANCATGLGPIDIQSWRRAVFAQFHDAIPGSAINEVYAELRPELGQIAENGIARAKRALARASGARFDSLFNPLPIRRTMLHRTRSGRRLLADMLPLSGIPLTRVTSLDPKPVRATRTSLSNGRVTARFDSTGEIEALLVDGRPVSFSSSAGQLWTYPDTPHAFDAWELDRHTLKLGQRVTSRATITVDKDPLAGTVAFARNVGRESRVVTRYRLEAASRVLRIEYEVEWNDPRTLLKTIFPTSYRGQLARFGSPFGSVLRDQRVGPASAESQWEVPGSRWALVSDDGEREGLFVVTRDKYGFGCRNGTLDVSLLRSALITGEGGRMAGAFPEGLRREQDRPRYSDVGRHVIHVAIGLWSDSATREDMPAALADTLFTPCVPYRGSPHGSGFLGLTGGESLIPAWAKPLSGSSWLLRLHETMGRRGVARLAIGDGWRAREAGILDAPGQILKGALPFGPYQVMGVIFERVDSTTETT